VLRSSRAERQVQGRYLPEYFRQSGTRSFLQRCLRSCEYTDIYSRSSLSFVSLTTLVLTALANSVRVSLSTLRVWRSRKRP